VIRVAVSGAAGRMGRSIVRLVRESEDLELVGALERAEHPDLGRDAGSLSGASAAHVSLVDDPATALARAQVVVDFSMPLATRQVLAVARRVGVAVVVGTTGLDAAAKADLDETAKVVPLVAAPNMSVGIQVLLTLVAQATRLLGPDYDCDVLEMHHAKKVDAPSGTALRLAEVVAEVRGTSAEDVVVHGRSGALGERPKGEIGVLALRGGDVVGDHTVVFAGAGERLELVHRSSSRENFAKGALRAARWVVGKPPRRYEMSDVLS
jgi:4-hydroxy-tetrahydrodipicolinate reductase